ncbi:hypothetical protein ACFWUQ_03105 [Streptomyces sp. NPDC058662]|uniref:hypothetical protein n=1 Tax=Streptomyces sp. NPDC058662 TaxID=3346583 RepID=UPI00364CF24E
MSTATPRGDQPVRPPDLERARLWLVGHGLTDVRPTALLAKRLAARQSSRLAGHLLLAAFIITVALVYTTTLSTISRPDAVTGSPPYGSLLLLTAVVAAFVAAQALLERRVRRIDRQAGEALTRRAAHPVRLGWRTVLGVPHAALAGVTFAVAVALTISALTVPESGVRYAAAVLLIGLCGAAGVVVVQLRHVLTHPAVADDEAALTADAIMRTEDAREIAAPTTVWCLPWFLPAAAADTGFGWWYAAWFVLIGGGAVTLALITLRTARRGAATARRAAAGG